MTCLPQTNLASALMFLGKVDEARNIFLAHRGKELGKQRWEDAILGDFKEFRKHGLTHPLMDDIAAAFVQEKAPAPRPQVSPPVPPAAALPSPPPKAVAPSGQPVPAR